MVVVKIDEILKNAKHTERKGEDKDKERGLDRKSDGEGKIGLGKRMRCDGEMEKMEVGERFLSRVHD